MQEYKILFAGGMGVGKTTAITMISDIPPVSTDVVNNDRSSFDKAMTTVSLDYGSINFETGSHLRLYGIPGQRRFDFMWSILKRNAIGLVLLADASRTDSLTELEVFLEAFADLIQSGCAVLGVGRLEAGQHKLSQYNQLVSRHNPGIPVFSVDVRKRPDVLLLLDALLTQIEINGTVS